MLTPDQIRTRDFVTALRGFDRDAVRRFLESVADTVAQLQDQIAALERRVEAAEARAENAGGDGSAGDGGDEDPEDPDGAEATAGGEPLDRAEAFRALGEEATRILVAAEESANEIRERAAAEAREHREEAQRDARAELEDARRRSTRIVAEAERDREAVVEELAEVEAARDELLTELRAVAETLRETTAGLAAADGEGDGRDAAVDEPAEAEQRRQAGGPADLEQAGSVEAGSGEEEQADAGDGESHGRQAQSPEPEITAASVAAESEIDGSADGAPDAPAGDEPAESSGPPPIIRIVDDAVADEPDADVADLTEAGQAVATAAAPPAEADDERRPDTADEPEVVETSEDADEPAVAEELEVAEEPDTPQLPRPVALREHTLETVRPGMIRRLKRALQDVQNATLTAIRESAGVGEVAALLPADEALDPVDAIGDMFLTAAFRGGVGDAASLAGAELDADVDEGSQVAAVRDDLRAALGDQVTIDLRATLRAGLEADEPEPVLSERVGEVFRDLKGPVVEGLVDRALLTAYGHGLLTAWQQLGLDAITWVLVDEARCPERRCRTNLASGAVSPGDEFPSGHMVPPAHDACGCGLQPATSTDEGG